MRAAFFSVLVFLVLMQTAFGRAFPKSGNYHIFIQGQYAGSCKFTSGLKSDLIIIDSETNIDFAGDAYNIKCHTELDSESYKPVSIFYNGNKPGTDSFSGRVFLERDSIVGDQKVSGNTYESRLPLSKDVETIFFENYVIDHEIVLARAYLRSKKEYWPVTLFYPSDFMASKAKVTVSSEFEMETQKGPLVCTKLIVAQEGSVPFYSYLDMDTHVPIYLDFPSTSTEVFLDGYFSREVRTKYHKLEK